MAQIPTGAQVPNFDAVNLTQDAQPQPSIEVSNITYGDGGIWFAAVDVQIGDILIRSVRLRKGRKDSVFLNFPSYRDGARWTPFIQIIDPALYSAVEQAIYRKLSEGMP